MASVRDDDFLSLPGASVWKIKEHSERYFHPSNRSQHVQIGELRDPLPESRIPFTFVLFYSSWNLPQVNSILHAIRCEALIALSLLLTVRTYPIVFPIRVKKKIKLISTSGRDVALVAGDGSKRSNL